MAEPAKTSPASSLIRAFGIVAALAVLVAGGVVVFIFRSGQQSLQSVFKSQVNSRTILSGAIGALNNNPKLVVLTADVEARVIKENTKHWAGINLGTTRVEVRAPAKVQYIVPLQRIGEKNFKVDAERKRIVLRVAPPSLDPDMVSVETDPEKIELKTEVGWGRLASQSGKFLKNEALRDLQEAAMEQGRHELLRAKAESNAREQLLKLLAPLAEGLREDASLEIEFERPR